jgi:cell division protein FtsI (penicillin-binding protein 3)
MLRSGKKIHIRETSRGRIVEQGKLRLMCVALFFILCFGSICVRLTDMMIHAPIAMPKLSLNDMLKRAAEPEEAEVFVNQPQQMREDVVDRNGVLLATNLVTASAFANPKEINNPEEAAKQLATTLRMDQKSLLRRLQKNNNFVWIKRHLTPKEEQAVNSLGIPGVYFLPEEQRVYPYGNMFSHVLGYVGVDNKGLSGLEKYYDRQLTDGAAKKPLKITLDMRVQHILRDEMQSAMQNFNGVGAAGIVMDAKTGEVLAMGSLPDFDPHHVGKISDDERFNRATLGLYEMGSTFKSLTMALGFDNGMTYKEGYDATNPFKVANFTIQDFHGKKRWLSVPEIFVYSSNIGTARMLLDVGIKKQKEFLKNLGMFDQVDVDLSETATPIMPREWNEIEAITISYGHGISVTPLHLVRAVAALVNGGTLKPVTLAMNENRKIQREKRVIDEDTSEMMRQMFRLVVTHGTGSKANAEGYRVGGKTGTADKILANGKYSENARISSFIGTFPVDDPRYVVYVMVDDPKPNKDSYGYATGGWVAAPAVGNIVQRMAPLVGIAPSFDSALDKSEKFWVNTDKSTPTLQAVAPVARPKPYFHATAY